MFYPNGEFIPYQMPDHFRQAQRGSGSCGDCGMYSNKNQFCGIYRTRGVRDTYVCNSWRKRHFQR